MNFIKIKNVISQIAPREPVVAEGNNLMPFRLKPQKNSRKWNFPEMPLKKRFVPLKKRFAKAQKKFPPRTSRGTFCEAAASVYFFSSSEPFRSSNSA
ncbi:MAG: hypothetical protein LUD52_02420 [Opitutae bacterium]|nr:hypothetical protein [Opitutae bacterium]